MIASGEVAAIMEKGGHFEFYVFPKCHFERLPADVYLRRIWCLFLNLNDCFT